MKKFYLISTNHLKSGMLFGDEDDFRVGMNIVAISAHLVDVKILSFILMSSHVHFVLHCSRNEAKSFIDKYKTLYSKYYCRKYGTSEFLRLLGIDIQEVFIEDESLFRAIAYVIMNCVAANLVAAPVLYAWGTGDLFFNAKPQYGQKLGEMSQNSRRKLLKSRVELPADYTVGDGGYILPCSYVPVKYVESLFRTPKRYTYFLNTSSKAKQRLEKAEAPSFSDIIVKAAMNSLINSLFRKAELEDLNDGQKAELFRQVQRRFSSDESQLVRVSRLQPDEVSRLINGFY
ncbi:MAG: hypothetical protein IKZ51_01550 [Bacteroidales bacterium]|nr:hypothetical protein [Bacteroidales bacterium]